MKNDKMINLIDQFMEMLVCLRNTFGGEPEIKPCLFCGSEGAHVLPVVRPNQSGHTVQVVCGYCGASGPTSKTAGNAIEAWNFHRQSNDDC